MCMNLNCVNKTPFAMGELSVKKKEEMSLRKIVDFAGLFTDSSVASSPPQKKIAPIPQLGELATEGVARQRRRSL